jgi:hypothetical protein
MYGVENYDYGLAEESAEESRSPTESKYRGEVQKCRGTFPGAYKKRCAGGRALSHDRSR